ncbi:hypothetical protein [Candidatus Amarolinea dominans]|uniref:hypothetical protein n=1 Tax=Candidatus Amarolinea dominans TaxID=3140696 RepID=UPI0031356620|nr:hypothetical protein [Anaerolineae bacterium]
MNQTPVPRLDLAPRLKRPLSLWNPLDYGRLLYWAFFFPQAIRWYIETFGKPEYKITKGRERAWQALRDDPVQLAWRRRRSCCLRSSRPLSSGCCRSWVFT